MSGKTWLELTEKVLKETKKPMTGPEIWNYIYERNWRENYGKTPWKSIEAAIYLDEKKEKSKFVLVFVNGQRKFGLKELLDQYEIDEEKNAEATDETETSLHYTEYDLHKVLSYFAFHHLIGKGKNVHTKTIRHERSKKGGFKHNEWMYPDLVGVYYEAIDWDKTLNSFFKETKQATVKLYSFELKKELSFGNLRKYFFQAVSNSSWANEGYLVTASISETNEFLQELRRLSQSFGIGIIILDPLDPDNSSILYPAKTKETVDWVTVNKLIHLNKEFKEFINRVTTDLKAEMVHEEKFDKIESAEHIISYFEKRIGNGKGRKP